MTQPVCPVCNLNMKSPGGVLNAKGSYEFECDRCGNFSLTGSAAATVGNICDSPEKKALLSHSIRKRQISEVSPVINSEQITEILENGTIPNPQEQLDNFILWFGNTFNDIGELVQIYPEYVQAVIGSVSSGTVNFLIKHLVDKGILVGDKRKPCEIALSFDGWELYQTLKRGHTESRKAFMAMKFGDSILDNVFKNCFKQAVKETGFELVRLDEDPKAGLIDDRLRVEILTSRFLITDLTHGNAGAYWEAGFAEGLGKPVIYTCEEKFFKKAPPYDKHGGTHFDTNHHLTVVWNENDLNAAAEQLKATIRATLPAEAIMTDE